MSNNKLPSHIIDSFNKHIKGQCQIGDDRVREAVKEINAMTAKAEIMSAKAKEYIEQEFISEYNDIERYLVYYGTDGTTLEKGRIGRCRRYADKAIIIAEQEAEDRATSLKSYYENKIEQLHALRIEECKYYKQHIAQIMENINKYY